VFGKINWSRWALLLVIAFTVVVSNGIRPGRSQSGPSQSTPILSGAWKLDTGETIKISQDSSGKVTAEFKPHVRCLDNSTRSSCYSKQQITHRQKR
jgi:hypothetical protein